MNKPYSVYCLLCPSRHVRYIGITCANPSVRLSGHVSDTNRKRFDHKTNWIRSLIKSGDAPVMQIVRVGLTRERAEFTERMLIRLLQRPFSLVNSHEGGSTGLAGMSIEARAKHRAAMRRLGGKNLSKVNHKAAQKKAVEVMIKNRIERGPDAETAHRRALDDARGEVLREGVTYSAAKPDGETWEIVRSKCGRTNQVDVRTGNALAKTCGIRTVERGMKRAKL